MTLLLSIALSSLLLVGFLNVVSSVASERALISREELSAYECGFEHHNVSRVPISLRYFMLTLLFLLFDLEVVFLLFMPFVAVESSVALPLIVGLMFTAFLYVTLFYEWNDGTLEWLVYDLS